MRVLIIGAGGRHRTEASLRRAARTLGHQAWSVDVVGWERRFGRCGLALAARLAERHRPDAVILTRHALRLGEENIRRLMRGRLGGFWHFDFAPTPAPPVLELARAAGTLYTTCRSQVGLFRAAGIPRVFFLPQAVDPEADHPASSAPRAYHCDLSFVGSGQYSHRHELLRRLAGVGRLQIRGRYWENATDLPVAGGPVRGREFARVIRGAAISVGAHATAEQADQCACASNRMWKVLGCGGFFLGPHMDGMDAFARHGVHCAWYRTTDEAAELARHYLAHPQEREAIAAAGRAHALAEHTYAHRVRLLLDGMAFD